VKFHSLFSALLVLAIAGLAGCTSEIPVSSESPLPSQVSVFQVTGRPMSKSSWPLLNGTPPIPSTPTPNSSGVSLTTGAGRTGLPSATASPSGASNGGSPSQQHNQVPATSQPSTGLPIAPGKKYTVQPGDWFYAIARRFGVSVDALRAANPNLDPRALYAGLVLNLPETATGNGATATPRPNSSATPPAGPNITSTPRPTQVPGTSQPSTGLPIAPGKKYTVQPGDWFYAIARRFGVSVDALQAANPNLDPRALYAGLVLNLPETATGNGATATPRPNSSATPSAGPNITSTPRPTSTPSRSKTPNIAAGERVNILLLGTDCRSEDKGLCRTDTMILATLDPTSATAGVVTIPRDLWVPIPGLGENRINTAYYYGAVNRYPGGGSALAKKTVEYNFGRRVDYYVLIDFNGFRKTIDALGGFYINIPKAIDDPEYPTEDYRTRHIHFDAGIQHMNGEQALEYARTRHEDTDFKRSKRQIQVILAVRERALRLDLLPKLPALLESMWGTVETDMKPQEILRLAQVASKIKTENIKTGSIDQTMTVKYIASGGADVLLFDRTKIGALMDEIIPEGAPTNGQSAKIK
jgi:LCP family protein required for cell wall assembly